MSVVIRSLSNVSQTLDAVALPPYASQIRARSTAALVAAVAARTIQMDEIDSQAGVTQEYHTPLTGAEIDLNDSTEVAIIDPAGTIAELTVNMPAAPYDGQKVEMYFDAAVTALTMAAGSATLKGALTAATAGGFASWRYDEANTTWWRVG